MMLFLAWLAGICSGALICGFLYLVFIAYPNRRAAQRQENNE
jgi:hypothetical protein